MKRARVLRMLNRTVPQFLPTVTTNEAKKSKDTEKDVIDSATSSQDVTDEIDAQNETSQLATIYEDSPFDEKIQQQPEEQGHPIDELEMLDKWDPMGEDFGSNANTLTIKPDEEPECVLTGKMSDDCMMIGEQRVCDFYLKHGTCADGIYCSRLHIDPNSRDKIHFLQREYEMNTGRTRMISSHLSPILLEPSDHTMLLVSVTMIEYPTKFYLVAPYEKMNFAGFNREEIDFYIGRVQQSSSIKTKLQKCHEQLARLFDHNYRIDNMQQALGIGQMVACKLGDGRFCRATILDNREWDDIFECYYKLFLIDAGVEVKLPRDSLYEIRASCLSEPPMAVLSRLELKPPKDAGKWPSEATSFFQSFVAKNKYLLCKVVAHHEQEGIFSVDLLDVEKKISITDMILAAGLAEPMKI